MSFIYLRIRSLYEEGKLTEIGLNNAVIKKLITEEQKNEIINNQ